MQAEYSLGVCGLRGQLWRGHADRAGETACLRCVFPSMSGGGGATCDTVGVLGPIITLIGSIAAAEGPSRSTGGARSASSRLDLD